VTAARGSGNLSGTVIARVALVLGCCLAALGCGDAGGSGVSCMMDIECTAGLTCTGLPNFATDGGACVEPTRACAQPCSTATDCNSAGSSRTFDCVSVCSGQKFCVPIF